MTAAGIIAEYDPLHNGHKYLTERVRAELSPHAVVVVMSGNFTQRGMPAVLDKFTRAELAVGCGAADLVLELPALYAVNGATEFARGGVRVLKGLGCITHIAFGSESGNAEALVKAAELTAHEDAEFKAAMARASAEGYSYPAAYSKAFGERFPDLAGMFDKAPNDMLAREYLKQDILQSAGLKPIAVKRRGAAHDVFGGSDPAPADTSGGFVSASRIRTLAQNEVDRINIIDSMPPAVFEALKRADIVQLKERYFNIVRYKLVESSEEDIAAVLSAGEGIEYALKGSLKKASSLNELIANAASRRFTYARVSRVLAQLLLGISKELYALAERGDIAYARVLALNERGAEILKTAKKTAEIPVYSRFSRHAERSAREGFMLSAERRASEVYSIISGRTLYDGSELVNTPKLQ